MSVKYLIHFVRTNAELLVTYNENGLLIESHFNPGTMEQDQLQIDFLKVNFPVTIGKCKAYGKVENVKVSEVPEDLSFERFWTLYDHKLGHKKRAEKTWDKLSDTERHKVFKHLLIYENYLLQNPQTMKKFPETYLSQQPWTN